MTAGKYLPSLAAKIILVAMSSLAFSRVAYTTRRQMHKSNLIRFSTLEPFAIDTVNGEVDSSFNPIGPPDFLSNLSAGESIRAYGKNITRLSSSPDIFLVKDLIATPPIARIGGHLRKRILPREIGGKPKSLGVV